MHLLTFREHCGEVQRVSVTVEEVKAVPPAQELPSQLKMRVAVSSVPSKART